MIKKLQRLFNTLRYLKPTQLVFFIMRRKLPARKVSFGSDNAVGINDNLIIKPISVSDIFRENTFRFLNQSISFPESIDWSPESAPRLWRYNLHYFDYLRQADLDNKSKQILIDSWVSHNPQATQPGWEPFTASLRIVNWIFYLIAKEKDAPANQQLLVSLYEQVLWLEKNDERHILANHYFENLKAFAFAGCFFKGEDAKRWLRKGMAGLCEQLSEQVLSDGGHYERSPQYHALMLENYLDLYNLFSNNKQIRSERLLQQLFDASTSGLAFLTNIVFPDEKIPLFNDSAYGIAPELQELADYADRLGLVYPRQQNTLINMPDSGIFGYRSDNDMIAIDCGDIGPSYQPGHTHCDFLSYELMLSGYRVVVDTGVCEYEPGVTRHYLRSSKAHNVVVVDGGEQSEIWGEFRVARRAKRRFAETALEKNKWFFSGAFDGFYNVSGGISHQRSVSGKLSDSGTIDSVEVIDVIDGAGNGSHHLESYIHLHPDIVVQHQSSRLILFLNDKPFAYLCYDKELNCQLETTEYYPEFGLRIERTSIVLSITAQLPQQLIYSINTYKDMN